MKKLSSVMFWVGITLMVLAFCLSNAHAQPYTSRYFHYNQYFDAPPPFTIMATTVDGADNNYFVLAGGGSSATSRGASISLYGNDVAGANTSGQMLFYAGNASGNGSIQFYTGGNQKVTFPYVADADDVDIVLGKNSTTAPQFVIRANTSDGDDDGVLEFTAGGGTGSDRSARLFLYGNEVPSYGGNIYLNTGNVASRNIYFQTYNGASQSNRLSIPTNADADDVDLVLGENSTTAPLFTIRGNTSDADDDGVLRLTGGGAYDVNATRGSYIVLWANEAGGAGALNLVAGDAAGNGGIYLKTGGNVQRVSIPYTADADDADIVLGSNTTTLPIFTIRGNTSDGDDDGRLQLTAGGAYAINRSAIITLQGNDLSGADNGGILQLEAGNAVAGGGYIQFLTGNSYTVWMMPRTTGTTADLVFGGGTANMIGSIRSNMADGSDNNTLQLTGGGSSTMSGTRGAYLQLEGEDVGGVNGGGNINLVGGVGASSADYPTITIRNDTADGSDWGRVYIGAGGDLAAGRGSYLVLYGNEAGGTGVLELNGGNVTPGGAIRFVTGGAFQQWEIPYQAANTTVGLKFGVNAAAAVSASIYSARDTDGTDDDNIRICGGGACTSSRGAYIGVMGNEASPAGTAAINTGDAAGGEVQVVLNNSTASLHLRTGYDAGWKSLPVACEEKTVAVGTGAAGVVTASNLCGSGIVEAVGARITQAPGGGATTFDIGCTGSGNLDQFCDGISTALNTTCTYPTNGDGTNIPWVQKTATTMTITTDANVTVSDMKIRVCATELISVAPTS